MTHAKGAYVTKNLLSEQERCHRECATTFCTEYGASLPGGPFRGTYGEAGDVRRCDHGRLWTWEKNRGRLDYWRPISRFWEPRLHRKATRALRGTL